MMKVSIAIIAYNHSKFIIQAVNSVLMQQVNFDYELVIGEDCSTDNTGELLVNLQKQHPNKIRLLSSEKNLGVQRNYNRTIQACQGQYIAVLDGDDYWTSPCKLQKQVDFLDSHPEFTACFHNVLIYFEDESRSHHRMRPPDQRKVVTFEDLLITKTIPTCSLMFRNGLVKEFPEWAYSVYMVDWLLNLLCARNGPIGYIDEMMATYRIHPEGLWSSMSYIQQLFADMEFLELLDVYLGLKYNRTITWAVSDRWSKIAKDLIELAIQQPTADEAMTVLEAQWRAWPAKFKLPSALKRQIKGEIYGHFATESLVKGDIATTRTCLIKAVSFDPSWLRNWGWWSMGLRSFLQQPISEKLHW